MGYTTSFDGQFNLNKQLTLDDYQWLNNWNETRHDENDPTIPGLYCQWVPTKNGKGIVWDGAEKFYDYVEWLKYLIKEFFEPRGYVLNGTMEWDGEEKGDVGRIVVQDNVVKKQKMTVTCIEEYEDTP